MRQSSSTGKSPRAVRISTLSTIPSAPLFSSRVNSFWDLEGCDGNGGGFEKLSALLILLSSVCNFSSRKLTCWLDLDWKKWELSATVLLFNHSLTKKGGGGKQPFENIQFIMSEIPDQWRHRWEHQKWINTASFVCLIASCGRNLFVTWYTVWFGFKWEREREGATSGRRRGGGRGWLGAGMGSQECLFHVAD